MTTLPSRNRRFDLYEDPRLRRALKAQRLLEAIRCDLARAGTRATLSVRPVRVGRRLRYRLEYADPAYRCNRTSFLTPRELDRLHQLVGGAGDHLLLNQEREAAS